ncbi:MAG: hypothetical protein ACPHRO_09445, partial [Nannocystaceae bacterium]
MTGESSGQISAWQLPPWLREGNGGAGVPHEPAEPYDHEPPRDVGLETIPGRPDPQRALQEISIQMQRLREQALRIQQEHRARAASRPQLQPLDAELERDFDQVIAQMPADSAALSGPEDAPPQPRAHASSQSSFEHAQRQSSPSGVVPSQSSPPAPPTPQDPSLDSYGAPADGDAPESPRTRSSSYAQAEAPMADAIAAPRRQSASYLHTDAPISTDARPASLSDSVIAHQRARGPSGAAPHAPHG